MTPLLTSSQPGAVSAQPRAPVSSDLFPSSPGPSNPSKSFRDTYGTFDSAVVAAFIANRSAAPSTQVMGTTDPSSTTERGSVSAYADNSTKSPTVDSSATTFTANGVAFGAGVDLTNVVAGMILDVGAADPFTVGVVLTANPQTGIVLVDQWRQSGAGAGTPANGSRVRINRQTSIWAFNGNVFSENAGDTQALVGFEMGVKVARDDSTVPLNASEGAGSRGYDSVALTSAGRPLFGFTSRGRFEYGYSASGMIGGGAAGIGAGFIYHKNHQFTPASTVGAAFLDEDSNADVAFRARRAAAVLRLLEGWVGVEANPRIKIGLDGIDIGGGAGVTDVDLKRVAASTLRTNATFQALSNVTLGGAASGVGFFAAGGAVKQAVAGAKGGNAALASLLAALAGYGLVTDNTTA